MRFDLYAKSDGGKIYNIEIQTTDNKDDLSPKLRVFLDFLNGKETREEAAAQTKA